MEELQISEDTIIYLNVDFQEFQVENLFIDMEYGTSDNIGYDISYAYSYDNMNFSQYVDINDFGDIIPDAPDVSVYISIKFHKIVNTLENNYIPTTLFPNKNVDNTDRFLIIKDILYDGDSIFDMMLSKTLYNIIQEKSTWNFYDNQQVSVDAWIKQNNAISFRYAEPVIYFKTGPIDTQTIHTLKQYTIRNVVSIKRIYMDIPDNDIPQDRVIVTEWDSHAIDEFMVHINKSLFEQAFGKKQLPEEKDYLFLPIENKLYRVGVAQPPKERFRGAIAWWETYLTKYEDDEYVVISDELKNKYTDGDIINGINVLDTEIGMDDPTEQQIFGEIYGMFDDSLNTNEKISKKTVNEKNRATENYANKLVDSTFYISAKESDKHLDFYDKRLKIIQVNPDISAFPITMYDNSTVEKNQLSMQYILADYTAKNKNSLSIKNNFRLHFNCILTQKFVGKIVDLTSNDLPIFTLRMQRNKLIFVNNLTMFEIDFDFVFDELELYNIEVGFDVELKQISVKLYKLENKLKTLVYNNIYIDADASITTLDVNKLIYYGGKYYLSETHIYIDDVLIFNDYVNPLLQMKQF